MKGANEEKSEHENLWKKTIEKLKSDYQARCPEGHKCYLTKQTYKDSDGKDSTEFKCGDCHEKGKCQDGAYVCE